MDLSKTKIQKKESEKHWLFRKITDDWVFGEVIVITSIVIGIYALNFHSHSISKKPEDWAHFATYLSGTVGVAAVIATLIVLVRTLTQQRELISFERAKSVDLEIEKAKVARYTAIYLIHRFERMNNFYTKAIPALENKNPETWKAIASHHLAFYDSYLINEQGGLVVLVEKMDSAMALNCIGAVDMYREVFAVMKSTLSDEAISQEEDHMARREINKLRDERRVDTIKLAQDGSRYCNDFLAGARALLEKERSI